MCHLYPERGRQVKTDLPWEENGEMCFPWGGLIGMQLKILKKVAYRAKPFALTETTGSQDIGAILEKGKLFMFFFSEKL